MKNIHHHSDQALLHTVLGKLIGLLLLLLVSTIMLMVILSITNNEEYEQKLGLLNNFLVVECGSFILLLLSAFSRGILK